MKKFLLLFCVVALLISGCQSGITSPTEEENPPISMEPMEMVFMAGYRPQANLPFVGAYVAREKGFFEEEGLKVDIQHSTGSGEHLQLVATGKVQVTTQDAAVLLERRADAGLPLVSIALIGQRGQQAFAALQSSGIETVEDWIGRTVGYKGTPPPDLFALLNAAGVDPDQVNLVNVGFDPRILSEGKVDVYPLYKSNEPDLLRSWGYELNLWDAADYGIPTLGLTYVTSEDTLENNPEMLQRFLRASLKGIEYAAAHEDEAVEIVCKYAGPEADPEHMRFMMETELKEVESDYTSGHGIGWQTQEQWQALGDMLMKYDAMPKTDVSAAFTTKILEAIP